MSAAADTSMTLYYWNILVLPDKKEIFVGLRERPETLPPFSPPEPSDELMPFTMHNSSPITEFDEQRGLGYTDSGRRYVVLGKPSDPTGLIQMSVAQLMQYADFQWKYDFLA